MIDIDSLTDADRGRWVTYGPRTNRGRILRWNSRYIFVVYWCNDYHEQHPRRFVSEKETLRRHRESIIADA